MEDIILKYEEFMKTNEKTVNSRLINYLCSKFPDDNIQYLMECEKIFHTNLPDTYHIFTKCIQRNTNLYCLEYMPYFEDWIHKYVNSWGQCDIFCYRIINPMIEKYPELYNNIQYWANNKNPYIRRLAVVSLIHSSQSFSVKVPFHIVSDTIDILISDDNYYIQKGIGWLLKYSYTSYPDNTMKYLHHNATKLSKIVWSYAMQKMNDEDKKAIRQLKRSYK